MKRTLKAAMMGTMGLFLAGTAADAGDEDVTANITTSVEWTSDNTYHLRDVIFVKDGATLTIQPGTKVVGYTDAELTTWAGETRHDSSALFVARGSKIVADGTAENPIVFTSDEDNGTWQPRCADWGNLSILGNAIIAAGNQTLGSQNGNCQDHMEGLEGQTDTLYGGTDDDDSSGILRYVSLRYGGSVLSEASELNGLSLGGVGRETIFDHVEIMNNIDDGIEIWGGTAQLKYISIWNIGDDSFDLDEGFRGKAQFGLIVQGWCDLDPSKQGSGYGDNCFEMDGAEDPDNMQPYANPQVYNFTVIGEDTVGDNGMAFRDNMRIQVGNSIFMDVGAKLISFEGAFDDLMYDAFTTLAHDSYDATGVDFSGLPYSTMAEFYSPSRSGNWSWLKDCVFYNINDDSDIGVDITGTPAGNETTGDLGLWDAAMNNVRNAANSPIVLLTRDATGNPNAGGMKNVAALDPRPQHDALDYVETAPVDGFFTPAPYRGAFSPDNNWLEGWSAADEFGLLANTGSNPSDPADTSIDMTASTFFSTTAGVLYTVEESDDMVKWSPIGTIEGDGSVMSVTDLDDFDSAKFYRAIAQ